MTYPSLEPGSLPEGEPPQETRTPDLPLADEHGFAVLEFSCYRCKRPGHVNVQVADVANHRRAALFCLPCQSPERFKWATDEHGHEYLKPLTEREGKKRRPLGADDRDALAAATDERTYLLARRVELAEMLVRVTRETEECEAKLRELDAELPDLQKRVSSTFNDPHYEQKDFREKLLKKVRELEDKLAKPAKVRPDMGRKNP